MFHHKMLLLMQSMILLLFKMNEMMEYNKYTKNNN